MKAPLVAPLDGAGLARVAQYLGTTTFASRKASARELEQRWSDSDGSCRSDVAYLDDPTTIDLGKCSASTPRSSASR